jgi:hypothetical protein
MSRRASGPWSDWACRDSDSVFARACDLFLQLGGGMGPWGWSSPSSPPSQPAISLGLVPFLQLIDDIVSLTFQPAGCPCRMKGLMLFLLGLLVAAKGARELKEAGYAILEEHQRKSWGSIGSATRHGGLSSFPRVAVHHGEWRLRIGADRS